MRNFSYTRAADVADAVSAAGSGAAVLAGGTELLNWMRLGIAAPDKVVDIGPVAELRGIRRDGDALQIGALATLNDVGESELAREHAPALAESCLKAASAQLRNRATLGGNVLQKTRCPYFRVEAGSDAAMPWPCNRRVPASGCAARESGYPRLALFGATEACVATHPSDPAVALVALDAVVQVAGPRGARELAMAELLVTPEDAAGSTMSLVEHRLGAGEIIAGYRVPLSSGSRHSAYLKVRERTSYEYAMVSAAATVERGGGRIKSARIALGSVAMKPWRLTHAEQVLQDQPFEPGVIDRALDAALATARAPRGNEFKIVLARNAARQALLNAGEIA